MKTLLMLGAAFALSVTTANAECPPNYMPYGPLCAAPGYDNTDPNKPAPTIDPDKPAVVAHPEKPAPTRRIITQLFDTNGKRIGQMVQDGDVVSYFYTVPAWPLIPQLSERPWSPRVLSTTDVLRILEQPVVVADDVWEVGTASVPYTQLGLPFMSAYAPLNDFDAVNGNDPNANTVGKPGGIGSDYVASRPAEPQQLAANCSLAATPELEAQCRGYEVVVAK